jgi:hypothetical protein
MPSGIYGSDVPVVLLGVKAVLEFSVVHLRDSAQITGKAIFGKTRNCGKPHPVLCELRAIFPSHLRGVQRPFSATTTEVQSVEVEPALVFHNAEFRLGVSLALRDTC